MHANETIVRDFYAAFAARDAAAMARFYHAEIFFTDPAFPMLRGAEAGSMWAMLCKQAGPELVITLVSAEADEQGGRAQWRAEYKFSKTGRQVVNNISAVFAFREGKIVRHIDSFNFWTWASQALGPIGKLLGWSWPLKMLVRKRARKSLDTFMARAA